MAQRAAEVGQGYSFTQNYDSATPAFINKSALKKFGRNQWNKKWKNEWEEVVSDQTDGVWKFIPKSWGDNLLTMEFIRKLKP